MEVIYMDSLVKQVKKGDDDDPSLFLENGKSYRLLEAEIHDDHMRYILVDFPDKKFNSVNFIGFDKLSDM